jgi:excisionase family DNA binding protein
MQYLSTQQAAEYIGISPRTLEAMRLSGRGPIYTTAGRLVRYSLMAIDKWLYSNQRRSTSQK